jgi:D-serine deaminase-like pyridoxal phosphate-dependent protein
MSMWYDIRNIELVDSPALLVYPEQVKDNIRRVTEAVDDIQRLRPHVKTNKMAEVTKLMQEAGIQKFKCATIAEAEMLGMLDAEDVVLAYQPVGPKVGRLAALIQQYPQTKYSCLTDNEQAAVAMAALFAAQGLTVPVWLDLNVGMNRTGIRPGPEALALYEKLHALPGVTPAGLHAYDGHIREKDIAIRTQQCNAAFEPVAALAKAIAVKELPMPRIIAGGTPTFPIHAQRKDVECSPGTFVFWDWGYQQQLPEQSYNYGALLLSRVIAVIDEHTLCLDLGHKSVAAENPQPRVSFLNAPEAQPVSQSEEHLVVRVPDVTPYPVGTVFYGVPYHICPSVALYDQAHIIEDNRYAGVWKVVARNRTITI